MRAAVVDRHPDHPEADLEVVLDEDPAVIDFRGRVLRPLRAVLCGRCGHAELYVEDPEALYRAYLAGKENARIAAQGQPDLPALPPDVCLACGAAIAPEQAACPSCGWTYESNGPA
jgi:hypothetical protein